MIPRIRGRAGQAEPGQGMDGKWFYEISIWDLTGEKQAGPPFQLGPFDSEEECCKVGRHAVKMVSEKWETLDGGQPSGKYLDLKNGAILRPWEDHS